MILITGGAYQGKLEYARKEYELGDGEIFDCKSANEDTIWPTADLSFRCLYHLEEFIFACVKEGIDAEAYLQANEEALAGKIIIADDISQGIVPMDEKERAWRETNGRCLTWLGSKADQVVRVFCGLAETIKGE